ncbi:MAG: hypothetical protein GY757_49860, partial [bacterium]|nr:hypothetical protein [bacterium]
MNMASKNPFNTGSPARGEGFLGRQTVVHSIHSFLRNQTQFNLLLFGQRRIGKTSLLRRLQDEPELVDMAVPVYFNLQDKASIELPRLLFEIADRLIVDLELDMDLKAGEFEAGKASFYFQNSFIPRLVKLLPDKKQLLLLFDEFDVLGGTEDVEDDATVDTFASRQFIPFTASLIEEIQAKEYPIKFIFAIGRSYKDLEPKRFGQIMKFGPQEELSYFSKEETLELLQLPGNDLPFDEEAIDEIYSLTFGHPYFTQCLASKSFDAAEKNNSGSVTGSIVREQLISSIKSFSSGVYWIWDSLSAAQQVVLFLIALLKEEKHPITVKTIREKAAAQDVVPAVENLPQILDKLETFKFIEKLKSGEYDFYVEFIRKWIAGEVSEAEIAKLLDLLDEEIEFRLNNARYFFRKKDYKSAILHYKEILDRFPYHFEALFHMGRCFNNLKDKNKKNLEKAIEFYQRAYNLNRRRTKKEYLKLLLEKLEYLEEKNQLRSRLGAGVTETEKILKEIQKVDPANGKIMEKLVEIYILENKDISEIEYLSSVKELNLRNKHLKHLPENIVLLENLIRLDLRDNEIHSLPFQVTQLKNIEALLLAGNPLNIPRNIVKGPVEAILNYITSNSGYKNDLNLQKQENKQVVVQKVNVKQETNVNIDIDINVELPAMQDSFEELKDIMLEQNP